MKYIFSLLVATLAIVGTASAASSECTPTKPCPGGPARGFNYTTGQMEMIPQCFPWVWLTDYYGGNIVSMYQNQAACQAKRAVDFRF